MAIQIARVEAALDQNRIVRPDHAIGREEGALEFYSHRAARDLIRVVGY